MKNETKLNFEDIISTKIGEETERELMLAFCNSGEGLTDTTEILLVADEWLIEYGKRSEGNSFFAEDSGYELRRAQRVADARMQLAKFAHSVGCNHPDFDYS